MQVGGRSGGGGGGGGGVIGSYSRGLSSSAVLEGRPR